MAGNDLYAKEKRTIPAKGQEVIGSGIAIGLPPNTYRRIAPRSGLAVKHFLTVNAGVIDVDYTGEIKIVLVNLGTKKYGINEGDKMAQLIVERIANKEAIHLQDLEAPTRRMKGFGSSDKGVTKQVGVAPDCLVITPGKLEDDQTPKAATINIQKETERMLNQKPRKVCQEIPRIQTMTKQPWKVTGC